MAFSIKQIKAILSDHNMPVDDLDKAAEEICGRHTADLESIKEQRDSFKKDAETLASVQEELAKLKESGNNANSYKVKYEAMKEEYEKYKADVEAKQTRAGKETAYKALLKEAGISDKRIDAIIKISGEDIDKLELDADGKAKNSKDIVKAILTEWSDFVVKESKTGADTSTPPENGGKSAMTKDEIFKIKDTSERQKAMAENHELFGF